jgi:hypothetical protein
MANRMQDIGVVESLDEADIDVLHAYLNQQGPPRRVDAIIQSLDLRHHIRYVHAPLSAQENHRDIPKGVRVVLHGDRCPRLDPKAGICRCACVSILRHSPKKKKR